MKYTWCEIHDRHLVNCIIYSNHSLDDPYSFPNHSILTVIGIIKQLNKPHLTIYGNLSRDQAIQFQRTLEGLK